MNAKIRKIIEKIEAELQKINLKKTDKANCDKEIRFFWDGKNVTSGIYRKNEYEVEEIALCSCPICYEDMSGKQDLCDTEWDIAEAAQKEIYMEYMKEEIYRELEE
jgi:hypothetical protein